MSDSVANLRYGRALFQLALQKNVLDEVEGEFQGLAAVLTRHPQVSQFAANSTISRKEKEAFLDKILPGINPVLLQFLKVLAHKKRFRDLSAIAESFKKFYDEHKGIQAVTVVTASELSGDLEAKLKTALEKRLAKTVTLDKQVDSSLLGGFIIRFNDKQINACYRDRLKQVKQLLLAH